MVADSDRHSDLDFSKAGICGLCEIRNFGMVERWKYEMEATILAIRSIITSIPFIYHLS